MRYLSDRARSAVSSVMKIGCFLKIYPYQWDPKNYRLLPATRLHMFLFRLHECLILWTAGFMTFRFFETIKDDVPSRIRIMNFNWVLAYILVLIMDAEFELKRDEVMFFINSLCHVMERNRNESIQLKMKFAKQAQAQASSGQFKRKSRFDVPDRTSLIILISSFLLFTNPPTHAAVLFSSPCAPQYITSLIFPCKSPLDIPVSFLEIFPFVILENFFITDMMFCGTFGFTFVFLGLTWIKEKLDIEDGIAKGKSLFQRRIYKFTNSPKTYREAQLITLLLNDSFKHYLKWYPNILILTLSMLVFGTIRYPHIDFFSYGVFPACALRCLFDVVNILAAAGIVNQASDVYLSKWQKEVHTIGTQKTRKFVTTFFRSCRQLTCTAGGLYTFENSIVLVSLDNCTQLVFNMLVTYD